MKIYCAFADCDFVYDGSSYDKILRDHMKIHASTKSSINTQVTSKSKKIITNNVRTSSRNRTISCDYCDCKFSTPKDKRHHCYFTHLDVYLETFPKGPQRDQGCKIADNYVKTKRQRARIGAQARTEEKKLENVQKAIDRLNALKENDMVFVSMDRKAHRFHYSSSCRSYKSTMKKICIKECMEFASPCQSISCFGKPENWPEWLKNGVQNTTFESIRKRKREMGYVERSEREKEYRHEYYERVTCPKRQKEKEQK